MECIKYINDLDIEIKMLNDALKECRDEREYKNISKVIESKSIQMNRYKENLSKLSDCQIEYRIYLKMLNGLSPTKAIEEVASENYINDIIPNTERQIWKYYKNLKNILNFSETSVN